MRRKQTIFILLIGCLAAFLCCGCATKPGTTQSWEDASIIAEQRLTIEQQQQRLNDMGKTLGELSGSLDNAIQSITASLEGNGDLQSKFREIDLFVRRIIESKRQLEELQRANSGTDAGER